jgi:hypothetical protein
MYSIGMRSLHHSAQVSEIQTRLAQLTPENPRQWGTMTMPQMLLHCSAALEMAMGRINPPRAFIGRILGPIIKPLALKESEPMRRNSPTAQELLVSGSTDFSSAREELRARIEQFAAAGEAGCSKHPHPFFGKLTAEAWGVLMYKHLDHHLRQFNA